MNGTQGRSLTASIIVHLLIIALLMMLTITTRNPPWDEGLAGGGGGGSFVEFGTLDFNDAVPTEPPPVAAESAPETEETITSDVEETVSVPPPVKDQKTKPDPKQPEKAKKDVQTAVTPVALPKVEPERQPDQMAMYPKKGPKGSPDGGQQPGNGTGGSGTGTGGGNGSGTGPGSGSGTGGGNGSGNGPGNGPGFNLTGRKLQGCDRPENPTQEFGTVIIAITVDKNGKVTSANGPERGSTNTSPALYQLARKAALTARFSPSAEGVEEQRGTISFRFLAQ